MKSCVLRPLPERPLPDSPADTFYGGYAGCFRDPDGHMWEIAFNPGFRLDVSGNLTVPPFGDPA